MKEIALLRKAYNIILDRVLSNKFGAFFIDAPGKSFVDRALLATLHFFPEVELLTLDFKFLLMSMKILLAILINKVH
ncbi:hypothetical protein H5410_003521 [Solanum commersonii]|uniref:Uncharacterized protein n=1 Tax=Solanum commersonii TaxID=4109 RepID=A0A9J6B5D7_SOLCO|nr:hypothetical protein H5410_003521 [Solanum commersonii]